MLNRKLSVAPMMDWTDRHDRFFLRLISHHVFLYSEMVTTGAILHGDKSRFLDFDAAEHPLALQLGGSEPADLAQCSRIAEDWGYDEVNLNVGCPSDRVKSGRFGACLMLEPEQVARCIAAMQSAVDIPVTVKCRIGVDDRDAYEDMYHFVQTVAETGCKTFIIHARKAWLQGLSPKQNREIPPLRYEEVYRLKAEMPQLEIIINGGIIDLDMASVQMEHLDGVMIGRAAYHQPYILAEADQRFFNDFHPVASPHQILEQFLPYVEQQLGKGVPLQAMSRHILGLFQGMPGARKWRQHISENAFKPGMGSQLLRDAARFVDEV